MMSRGGLRWQRGRLGFTTLELVIALALGGLLLSGVYKLIVSHRQLYSVHRETLDVRESLRAAGTVLTWDLSSAAASGGDLYAISTSAVVLRSLQATGIVCADTTIGSEKRFGLQQVSGYFDDTADDSALVYSRAGAAWDVVTVQQAWNGSSAWSAGGTPVCFWGDSSVSVPRPQATVQLSGDSTFLAGLTLGAVVRAFRRTEYGLFEQDGRWWLGRRIGAATSWETLSGPMFASADSGLILTYYDGTGAVTTDSSQVARVEILLRAESFGRASGLYKTLEDSLRTMTFLRNN